MKTNIEVIVKFPNNKEHVVFEFDFTLEDPDNPTDEELRRINRKLGQKSIEYDGYNINEIFY